MISNHHNWYAWACMAVDGRLVGLSAIDFKQMSTMALTLGK